MIDTFWQMNTSTSELASMARNIVEIHRNVCTMLGAKRSDAGALWAFDNRQTLIIRSHAMPDVAPLDVAMIQRGIIEPVLALVASAPVPDAFVAGDRYMFQLTASPTKRDNKTKLDMRIDPGDWLRWRSDANGLRVHRLHWHTYTARGGNRQKKILLPAAAYDGELEVIDPDAFADLMRNGIGRGKSYGMGLLTLS